MEAMRFDYERREFLVNDTECKQTTYAPEDLQENEKVAAGVNFIRNLMGIEPVFFPK